MINTVKMASTLMLKEILVIMLNFFLTMVKIQGVAIFVLIVAKVLILIGRVSFPIAKKKFRICYPDPSYEVWDIKDLSTICTDCTNCTSDNKEEKRDIPSENNPAPTPLLQSDPDTTEYTLDDVIKLLDNYALQGDEVDYQLNKNLITSNNKVSVTDYSKITVK